MAAFKVGQRVRVIDTSATPLHAVKALVGAEGTIVRIDGCATAWAAPIEVSFSEVAPLNSVGACQWSFWPDELAPLLPPDSAADQFLARIRKLGSEPINDAPKERVTK